jgi:threonine/homoserine/homoserine lactone efflux protein
MSDFVSLAIAVVATSASGVLAPGPLFFATLSRGSTQGIGVGLHVSLGHAAVELPLVVLMALGVSVLIDTTLLSISLGLIGGFFLIILGASQLRFQPAEVDTEGHRLIFQSPFLIGVSLTLFNPFFMLWWFTVGLKLVLDAFALAALGGVLYMFATHIWMDFTWLGLVAFSGLRARRFLGGRWFVWLIRILGLVLIGFGLNFILSAATQLHVL